ncbi:MAG: ATPase, partial [Hyphomicrobium sp.]
LEAMPEEFALRASTREVDVCVCTFRRASVADLSLWHRIGVADRPSVDLALQWVGTLISGAVLSAEDGRRVRTLLVRYPIRIWEECGHWVNLLGEWAPAETLAYALSMQTLFRWSHLHDWVKRKTADLQRLPAEIVRTASFSSLTALSELIDERFNQTPLFPGVEDQRAWLIAFGTQLGRIELAGPEETERVRATAAVIAQTTWVVAPKLEVIPYLDGVPAGTARLTDLLWLDRKLFVSPLSKAKLAKRVPEEIGKTLSADIRAALAYSFERSPEDIKAYLEENFALCPERITAPAVVETADVDVPATNGGPAYGLSDGEDDQDADIDADADEPDASEAEQDSAASEPGRPTAESGEEPEEVEPEVVNRSRAPPKPHRPNIMVRFALAQGYRPDGDDRFFHADGSWISRVNATKFPWERRSSSGELQCHYYPKEHCLEREPLQIEADIWGLVDQKPDIYSFILINPEGAPVEMTGTRLRALREGGEMTIHPATYRLVYDLDHQL